MYDVTIECSDDEFSDSESMPENPQSHQPTAFIGCLFAIYIALLRKKPHYAASSVKFHWSQNGFVMIYGSHNNCYCTGSYSIYKYLETQRHQCKYSWINFRYD